MSTHLFRVSFKINGHVCSPVRVGCRQEDAVSEVQKLFPGKKLTKVSVVRINGKGEVL